MMARLKNIIFEFLVSICRVSLVAELSRNKSYLWRPDRNKTYQIFGLLVDGNICVTCKYGLKKQTNKILRKDRREICYNNYLNFIFLVKNTKKSFYKYFQDRAIQIQLEEE